MISEDTLMMWIWISIPLMLGILAFIIWAWLKFLRFAYRFITKPSKGDKWP
jgi:hypothetical protein